MYTMINMNIISKFVFDRFRKFHVKELVQPTKYLSKVHKMPIKQYVYDLLKSKNKKTLLDR